jgi:hypothetical protein
MSNFIKSYQANVGLNHVPAYQVSGQPFATGSLTAPISSSAPIKVEFPYVTRWVKVIPLTGSNSNTHLRVGFSENGIKNGNYYRLFAGNNANHEAVVPEPLEMKVSELYFLGDDGTNTIEFDVVAGLTSIPASRTTTDSGPSWSGSAGVG